MTQKPTAVGVPAQQGSSSQYEHWVTATPVDDDAQVVQREGSRDPNVSDAVVVGAGAAGLIAGTVIAGPLLGIAAGVAGATVAATQKKGTTAGDVARSAGQLMCTGYERAKEVQKRHDLMNKAKAASQRTLQQAQSLNEQHRITERASAAAAATAAKAQELNEKHKITERVGAALVSGMNRAQKAIEPKDKQK